MKHCTYLHGKTCTIQKFDFMANDNDARSLPEKVLRRHAEMLDALIPEISRQVREKGRPADGVLTGHLRAHREFGSRDRRFLSQAVFSYFRWYGWTVGRLGRPPAEACLLGAALDSTDLEASFRHLEQRCPLPAPIEPLGDRTLQEKADALAGMFQEALAAEPLQLADLVHPDFVSQINPEQAEACIEQFQQRPPAWLRVRTEPAPLLEALSRRDAAGRQHDRLPQAVSVKAGVALTGLLPEHLARFVVQDIASQCVGIICAPQPNEEWWDCCAGAGGKTLHLMDLMNQTGRILSTDIRPAALKELKKRARKYGIRGVRTQLHNAVRDEPFKKSFDGILVDAPCSGWGTWGRNPDARWRTSRREVTQCANRQAKLLNNASWCTRPGGVLVYAVCTLTRQETEEVVMNFLDQNPGFALDPFPHPLTGAQTDGQVQLWPWEGPGDAMFIARFVRSKESL
jgi:16S rRNA (cytosine967-C5)-methyltransferase